MPAQERLPVRFSWITVVVWLLVAAGSIFLLWQLINRLSARSLPISTATPNQTQVYQTIAALLTPIGTGTAEALTHTSTPSPSPNPIQVTIIPRPSQATTTPPLPGSPTSVSTVPCDRAAAGNPIDISIPDDSLISPGQSFIKTWKLVNSGSCTWTIAYSANFFYGDRMQAAESVALNEMVLPEQSVEISIDMVAPEQAGVYQGNWMLSNPSGVLFGIGPNGDSPFWVRIVVPENPSSTATQGTPSTPGPTATQGTPASPSPTGSATATPTSTSTPSIQARGVLTPLPGETMDLDTVKISTQNADLIYQADASNYHWLAPAGEARLGVYGNLEPGLPDCQSASMSQAPIAVESLALGTYLCYRTNEERFGRALFVALQADNYALTLDLLTWAHP